MAWNIGGWLAGLGAILVAVGGIFGWGLLPSMIEDEITKNVVLAKDSTSYKFWNKLPQPMEFKVYVWEVENPDEVQSNGAKPKMKETGPYTYLLNKTKENITFSEDGNFVEFEQRTFYEFVPELSPNLSEDDEVTVLNSALLGLIYTPDIKDSQVEIIWLAEGYGYLFDNTTSIFTKVKVRDLFFDGTIMRCEGSAEGNFVWYTICAAMKELSLKGSLPPFIRYDEKSENFLYSFFNHKKEKTDGHFKVLTGKSDVSKLGEIVEWEHNSTLQFWSGDECNTIRGSDATIFPPFLNEETKINLYSTDLCRSLYMTYDQKIGHSGIDGHRYVVDPVQLGNVSSMPENYCYCPPNGACLKDGANDLTDCYKVPVIFSMPHFYGAPHYEQMVENLKPNKEKHQMFLDVETNTGAPLRAGRRVQFNLMIKPFRNFNITRNLPEAAFPLFWVDEALELNKENTDLLKDIFVNKVSLVDTVRWTLLGVGCVLFLIGTALHCHKQTAPMKNIDEVPM